MVFADHRAIVHPDRKDGAYAVEGLFRFSHLSTNGSAEDLPVVGVSELSVILPRGELKAITRRWRFGMHVPKEPSVVEHNTDGSLTLYVLLAVSTCITRETQMSRA